MRQHLKLDENQIPLAMIQGNAASEHRAVTAAPTDVGVQQRPIQPYVFPQSAAAFLEVSQPRVPIGEQIFPVLTSPATVELPALDAAVTETTGTFSVLQLSTERNASRFLVRSLDLLRFGGMEQALRAVIRDSLSDELDAQIIEGFFAASGGLTEPGDPGMVATFADYDSFEHTPISTGDMRTVRPILNS